MSGFKDSEIIATATKHSSADSFKYPNEELEGFTSCEVCGHFVPTEEIREVIRAKMLEFGSGTDFEPVVCACCKQCNPMYTGDYEKPLFTRILSIFRHEIVFVPIMLVVSLAILYSFV